MDELLARFNISPSTLTLQEKETLTRWADMLNKNVLGITEVKEYITGMIIAIERELTGFDNPPTTFATLLFRGRRERHLKARLQNYVLLRDFITSPERARSYVEKQLGGFKTN